MPIYEYECSGCHHRFDRRQSFDEQPIAACPKCRGKSQRIIHPVSIVFKGSGFYVTDYGNGRSSSSTSTPPKTENKKAEDSVEKSEAGEKKESSPVETI
ncbi:MAG: zinc ribbon domain-containing protein [Chloroflexi bacterium]|nr:zinc ribbon domain-containing protein [Chloroflexota bacterium]